MTDTKCDDLTSWLRDAHAMEAATIDNLKQFVRIADDYPELKPRLQGHLEVSQRQLEEIGSELDKLGSDPSTLKDWGMKAGGQLEPLLSKFTADSIVKNCLAAYAYENFEIASYRALVGAAEELGMAELRAMCERFVAEEQEMADFLYDQLPEITRQHLRTRTS